MSSHGNTPFKGPIYCDGPGSWARGAYWDKYQVRVNNAAGEAIEIERVVLVDVLDGEVVATSEAHSSSAAQRR